MAEVIYVLDDLSLVTQDRPRISPDRIKTSCPKGARFAVRWSRRAKMYEAYDLRRYVSNPSIGQFYAAPPPSVQHPDRDAVIGYAMFVA